MVASVVNSHPTSSFLSQGWAPLVPQPQLRHEVFFLTLLTSSLKQDLAGFLSCQQALANGLVQQVQGLIRTRFGNSRGPISQAAFLQTEQP